MPSGCSWLAPAGALTRPCFAVSDLGRGGSWGPLDPPTAALLDCHASELALPSIHGCSAPRWWDRPATARPAGGPGAGAAGDRGHGRVPPGRDAASASRRAETIPVRAWRAGRRRDARREGARIHTSSTLRGRGAGSGGSPQYASTGPSTPPRCARTAVVAGRRAGHAGRRAPVYAMNSIERGLALHSFWGHTGCLPPQTPAASEPTDAPGRVRSRRGSGGPSCAPAVGDPPTSHLRHLRHGLRKRSQERRLPS